MLYSICAYMHTIFCALSAYHRNAWSYFSMQHCTHEAVHLKNADEALCSPAERATHLHTSLISYSSPTSVESQEN